jgi:uncharacterized cofD-like protein
MSIPTRISQPKANPPVSPLRIVSIGGGTGLSTLLCGLKKHARGLTDEPGPDEPIVDITALVTVSDDGGSSGRLRRDFDILPPGDIRNCMTALSEDEHLLSQLFQYRFASGRGLKGHSFGNLFLAAMNEITGDFARAVRLSSEILAIRGKIYPATSANVTLEAVLQDGSAVRGETKISRSKVAIDTVHLRPADCLPLPEALDAISKADLITLGPGSLYTSVIPNLLVSGIADAIDRSPALKVCFINLMWQPGETIDYTASRHVEAIHAHAGHRLTDYVVLNSTPIPLSMQRKYARARVRPVENDFDKLAKLGVNVVTAELLAVNAEKKVRHDPSALADVAIALATRSRAQQARRSALAIRRQRIR